MGSGWVHGFGGETFLVSSVLVVVPSGDWVTVFSFDLTVPSLLTLLVVVLDIVCSHPVNKADTAKTAVATTIAVLRFMIEK